MGTGGIMLMDKHSFNRPYSSSLFSFDVVSTLRFSRSQPIFLNYYRNNRLRMKEIALSCPLRNSPRSGCTQNKVKVTQAFYIRVRVKLVNQFSFEKQIKESAQKVLEIITIPLFIVLNFVSLCNFLIYWF